MTSFEIEFRRFKHQPKSDQLSIIFTTSMELIVETRETAEKDMNPSHPMIRPIVNRKFGNKFQHQDEPNQRQCTHKYTSKQYQHINNR